MSLLNLTKAETARALIEKMNLRFRGRKERNAWFELDGRKILRVSMPKGRGQLPPGTANSIRDQVKLSREQFADLIRCPLRGRDYEQIIREKMEQGLL